MVSLLNEWQVNFCVIPSTEMGPVSHGWWDWCHLSFDLLLSFLIKTSRWIYMGPNCSALCFSLSGWVNCCCQETSRWGGCIGYIGFIGFLWLFSLRLSQDPVRPDLLDIVWFGGFLVVVFFFFFFFYFSVLYLEPQSSMFGILCAAIHFLCSFQEAITVIGLCPTRITASSCSVTSWVCARMLENKTSKTCLQVKPSFRLLGNTWSLFFCFKCPCLTLERLSTEEDGRGNACRVIL